MQPHWFLLYHQLCVSMLPRRTSCLARPCSCCTLPLCSTLSYSLFTVLKWFIFCVSFLQLQINYRSQPSSHGCAPWKRSACVCVFYHCHLVPCCGIILKIRYTKDKYIMSEKQQTPAQSESSIAQLPPAEFTWAHEELVFRLCSTDPIFPWPSKLWEMSHYEVKPHFSVLISRYVFISEHAHPLFDMLMQSI